MSRAQARKRRVRTRRGARLMRMSRPLSLRTDEFNYTLQILLAATVGVLAALGNLGFRVLIEFFTWVFLGLEWGALGIARGGLAALSGAGGAAERRRRYDPARLPVSGRRTRLRLSEFSRDGESRQRADQAALDCAQGAGRGAVARMRRLGRTRGTDRADRRRDRLGGRAIAPPAGQPRQGPDRRRRGRRDRHHLQRSGRRRAVCAGDRAPGRDRARQSDACCWSRL